MVKITINGESRYFDGYTISNLDQLKKAVELKWDGVLLYGGYEGDGKTTKCAQDMAYLDQTFNIDRVCFNLQQLAKLMDELPPGSAVMYDESWKDTSNMNKHQSGQRELIRILTEKRKRRLYIGIVSATFFDLNKYFVIHRTRAYIHIYSSGLERGFFRFYNRERKQDLYIRGKRDWNMNVCKPNFSGRFTNWLPFDTDEYERRKDEYTKASKEEDKPQELDEAKVKEAERMMAAKLLTFLSRNRWIKPGAMKAVASYLGVGTRALQTWKENYEIDSELAQRGGAKNAPIPNAPRHTTVNLPKGLRLEDEPEDLPEVEE